MCRLHILQEIILSFLVVPFVALSHYLLILHFCYKYCIKEVIADDSDGKKTIEFENGVFMPMQDAFDDVFDWLNIIPINENGNRFMIIDEELA